MSLTLSEENEPISGLHNDDIAPQLLNLPVNDLTPRLCSFEELPTWQRDNIFIRKFYRVHYTSEMCWKSVVQIHNETLNIWSHLVGFFILILLTVYAFTSVIDTHTLETYIVILLYVTGTLMCMAGSTIFHTFTGHISGKCYKRMRSFDYFGITALIVFSFIPPCVFAFHCQPKLKWGYLAMIGTLGLGGLIGPLFNIFHAHCFLIPRLAIYISMVLSGFAPLIHAQIVVPMGDERIPIITGLVTMFLLYGIGVLIYALKNSREVCSWFI